MQERRTFNRYKLKENAEISMNTGREETGLLIDASVGGMRILLSRQVGLNSRLSGEFKIIPYLGPFYVQGVVVWTEPAKDAATPCWEVGVKFIKVNTILI